MCCTDDGCERPEQLEGKPEDCSPEQVRECHGETEEHSCEDAGGCEQPEKLSGRPGDCSEEQIEECHGSSAGHPCD